MTITTWRLEPNACHYTSDKIQCSKCGKPSASVYDVRDIGMFCPKCWIMMFTRLIALNPAIHVRLINDIEFSRKVESKKAERAKMSLRLRFKIMERDGFQCTKCGSSAKEGKLEVDHIIPISAEGTSAEENLTTLCFRCNRGKGSLSNG